MTNELRFRLRNGEKVTGFVRRMPAGGDFFSRDGFWWTGTPLPYEQIDEWTGWKDLNQKHIFEYDIVSCKLDPDGPSEKAAVLWDEEKERFSLPFFGKGHACAHGNGRNTHVRSTAASCGVLSLHQSRDHGAPGNP